MTMNESQYAFSRAIEGTFSAIFSHLPKALKAEGFGILTQLDMQAIHKDKLKVDISPYLILGVCKPKLAQRAIAADSNAGLVLPCKLILRQEGETVVVAMASPIKVFGLVGNPEIDVVAAEAEAALKRVIASL